MMEARKISEDFSSLSGNVKGFIRLKLDLYKLMIVEAAAQLISSLMISLVVILLSMFFLFFLGLAFVYWYGEVAEHTYVGALIVTAFYLVVSIIVFIFRDKLFVNPLISKLTTAMHEEEHDEDQ